MVIHNSEEVATPSSCIQALRIDGTLPSTTFSEQTLSCRKSWPAGGKYFYEDIPTHVGFLNIARAHMPQAAAYRGFGNDANFSTLAFEQNTLMKLVKRHAVMYKAGERTV